MKNHFDFEMPIIAPPNTTGIPRILVPGGIGDIYWIMVKMEAFCKHEGIKEKPEILILADRGLWESSTLRALPFLKMIPFIKTGEPPTALMFPEGQPKSKHLLGFYRKAGLEFGQMIWPEFLGYEYFISYNGLINTGHWLEKDDNLECNWYFSLKISDEQRQFENECKKKYGKYAVFYFSIVGDFLTKNMAQFSLEKMAESINHFVNYTGLTPVFIGAWWDLKWPNPRIKNYLPILISKIPGAINLVGKTTLDKAFGVMCGAELVSGYHSGLTNMAIMFKKKTVLLWATDRFPSETPLAIAPPNTRNTTYIPLLTGDLTIDIYRKTMIDLYEREF